MVVPEPAAVGEATLNIVLGSVNPIRKDVQLTQTVDAFKQWLANAFRISSNRLTLTLVDQPGNQRTHMTHRGHTFADYGIRRGHEPRVEVTALMRLQMVTLHLNLHGPDFQDVVHRTLRTFDSRTVRQLKQEIKASCHDLALGVDPYVAVEPTEESGLYGVELVNGDDRIIAYLVTEGSRLEVGQDVVTAGELDGGGGGGGSDVDEDGSGRKRAKLRNGFGHGDGGGHGGTACGAFVC